MLWLKWHLLKTAYEQYTDHNSAADMIEIYIV